MKYRIQEGCEVVKTLDDINLKHEETSRIDYKDFYDRFKTWEQLRAERYNC